MCKNVVQPDRLEMKIWRMRAACWTPKATDKQSEYVILIVFSLCKQWLPPKGLKVTLFVRRLYFVGASHRRHGRGGKVFFF